MEQGKLVVSAIDLVKDLEQRPVARQLRHSLLQYMSGAQFAPATSVPLASLHRLFRSPTWLQQQEATARANSQQSGYEAERAIDANPDTIWHTAYGPGSPSHPHDLVLDLQGVHEIRGLTYLPRQDMANGRIANYEIYACEDGSNWGPPLAAGEWPDTNETPDRVVRADESGLATSSWSRCPRCMEIRSLPPPRLMCCGSAGSFPSVCAQKTNGCGNTIQRRTDLEVRPTIWLALHYAAP